MNGCFRVRIQPDPGEDLGDGFFVRGASKDILKKYSLLGQGSLHFINTLSNLVDKKPDSMPEVDFEALKFALKRFLIDYEGGKLYRHLLQTHGPEAINYNAWVQFAYTEVWTVCVRTFTDMPTDVLEEFGVHVWKDFKSTVGKVGNRDIMNALSKRKDIYGENGGLPAELVAGILFDSNVPDTF